MNSYQKKVMDFLASHDMDYRSIDLQANCALFMAEMEQGLGDKLDDILLMLPTYLKTDDLIPSDEPVIVIDAGGTNLRVALIHFDSLKRPVTNYFESYKMPGLSGEISTDEFFETIYNYLTPIIDKSDRIGFCFSYATEILPNKDGRVLTLAKEIKVSGLAGAMLGSGLLSKISEKGVHSKKSIIVLNDSTATLLGGKAAFAGRIFENYMGMILGTGFNICYVEKVDNIVKLPTSEGFADNMIINIETSHYSNGPLGKIDAEYDSGTAIPGSASFEKAISGAYQGGIIHTVIKQAAREGLFSKKFAERLPELTALSTKDANDFLNYPYNPSRSVLASLVCNVPASGAGGASGASGTSGVRG
ncbi:MAG: hypothetical protein FWH55_10425, partial [Oscillospiraceae bacterium]|nr:hypothetical protein [Oscillospiraceae bacterium]